MAAGADDADSGASVRGVRIPIVVLASAVVAALYGWAVLALTPTRPGAIGLNLNALGTDWMVFYGGVQWFLDGNLAALFEPDRFTAYLNHRFSGWLSAPMPVRPWLYPPSYLLIVLPFGLLPFAASYAAFVVSSAALLAAALWFSPDRPDARGFVLAAALLGPAAAINAAMGQNAFLTAALLVAGFRLLPLWPVVAGALLGLLTVKPQLFLFVPVALAAAGQWKALFSAAIVAVALVAVSAALFGIEIWRHWFEAGLGSPDRAQASAVEFIRVWGNSIYACLRAAGVPDSLSGALQLVGLLVGIAVTFRAFRRPGSTDRKIALLLATTIFAAPHTSIYETVLLAIAAALWISEVSRHEVALACWTLALALWLTPLVGPPVASPIGRLIPLLILGFIVTAMAGAGRSGTIQDRPRLRSALPPSGSGSPPR